MGRRKKMVPVRKTVLILEYTSLPSDIAEVVADWSGFRNDVCLDMELRSEFNPADLANGVECIKEYWRDQKSTNSYKGAFEKFVKDYGLQFEMWLVEQKFDLDGIDQIFINVCW